MKKILKQSCFYLVLSILVVFGESCDSSKEEKQEESKFLELTKTQLQTMTIPLVPVKMQAIRPIVFATGKVTLLPNSEAIISSNIGGKIEKILVVEGEYVKQGQPLFILTSMELIELQQSYLAARNEVDFLTLEYERQTELRKKNIGSLAEFQQVESKYRTAKNSVEAIGEKLKLLGIDLSELNSKNNANVTNRIRITSPISGSVFKLPATLGQTVGINDQLAYIINLTKLQADVDVYEKDIDQIREGEEVEIRFINQSIPTVNGIVGHILKSIDPESRSIPVFVNFFPPKNGSVLPEMVVKVKITGQTSKEATPTVPLSALLQEGELYYIYYGLPVKDSLYEFHKLKVTPGENDDVYTEIALAGIIPGNALVVRENVYLVDAEAKKRGK